MNIRPLANPILALAVLAAGAVPAGAQVTPWSSTGRVAKQPVGGVGIQVLTTGVPGQFPATDAKLIAFHTDEGVLGADLNGDGNVTAGMFVIQYWVITTGTLINTQEEGLYPSVSQGKIAFVRWEGNGGGPFVTDWNGDGDTQDFLVAFHDTTTGVTTDTLIDGRYPDIDGDQIVFHTYESNVGPLPGTVLNGDADTADPVIRYYTISTATLTNTMSAGRNASVSGDTIVFTTWETWCWNGAGVAEPGVPNPPFMNADADWTDFLLREHSISAGVTTCTCLDCVYPTVDGANVARGFDEMDDDGAVDKDSDADTIDLVLHLYDRGTALDTNVMLPITSIPTVKGRWVAFDLEEIYLGYSLPPGQGTELNGNAFPGDHIVCFVDRTTGAFTSTGVMGFANSGDSVAGNIIAFEGQWNGLVGWVVIL